MNTLAGKTLIITGATRGIGKAIALRAARDGANVAVLGKTETPHPKLPGTVASAALEIELRPEADGRTRIVATGYFHPAGAPGLIYWYSLAPIHMVMRWIRR